MREIKGAVGSMPLDFTSLFSSSSSWCTHAFNAYSEFKNLFLMQAFRTILLKPFGSLVYSYI
jgi:hypothetical protein